MVLGLRRLQRLGLIIYKGERIKMGHEEKKCKVLMLIERLGLPVFLVSHTRDERDLQTNLKVENVFFFSFFEKGSAFTHHV